jgi:hypothetical protein
MKRLDRVAAVGVLLVAQAVAPAWAAKLAFVTSAEGSGVLRQLARSQQQLAHAEAAAHAKVAEAIAARDQAMHAACAADDVRRAAETRLADLERLLVQQTDPIEGPHRQREGLIRNAITRSGMEPRCARSSVGKPRALRTSTNSVTNSNAQPRTAGCRKRTARDRRLSRLSATDSDTFSESVSFAENRTDSTRTDRPLDQTASVI